MPSDLVDATGEVVAESGGPRRMARPFAESKAVVQLVLPQGWVARLNALALARGLSRSALIREAIAASVFADHGGAQLGAERQSPAR
jgi:hypothetical protein